MPSSVHSEILLLEIVLKLDKDADELYSEANQLITFTAIVQSRASRYLARVSVDLQGPPEVKIIKSPIYEFLNIKDIL